MFLLCKNRNYSVADDLIIKEEKFISAATLCKTCPMSSCLREKLFNFFPVRRNMIDILLYKIFDVFE